MKAILKTAIGLIFDDWWLGTGLLFSILLTSVVLAVGVNAQLSGWLLLLLCVGTLLLSLRTEYLKKTKKS